MEMEEVAELPDISPPRIVKVALLSIYTPPPMEEEEAGEKAELPEIFPSCIVKVALLFI